MLKKIIGGVFAALVLIVGLGFVLPDKAHVERSVVINAPPEKVFALISDFNQWRRWSPWADLDPNTVYEISGSGVGHRMSWRSADPNVGAGVQTVTAIETPSRLVTHLEFGDMGKADATMTLTPEGEATKVVWSLDSKMREGVPVWMQPMATYMGFFMDGMVGRDYEKGLAKLKAAAEGQ
jgi:uncharacterized protein YndB with AHSA1/START domain